MNRSNLYSIPAVFDSHIWQPIGFFLLAVLVGSVLAWLPPLYGGIIVVLLGLLLLISIQPLFGLGFTLLLGPFGAFEHILLPESLPAIGQIAFLIAIASWLARGVLRKQISIPNTILHRPLTFFILVTAISLLDARSLDQGLKEVAKWAGMGLAMLLTVDLASHPLPFGKEDNTSNDLLIRLMRWIVVILLLAGVSQAVIGIWQFGIWQDGPEHFLVLERFYRAFGTFMQPNPFGGYMGMTAALAIGSVLGFSIQLRHQVANKDKLRIAELGWYFFLLTSALLTLIALVMSWSRGAWLGFDAAIAVLAVFAPKRIWKGVVLVLAGALLLIIALKVDLIPISITQRLSNLSQDSFVTDVRGVQVTTANFADVERLAHWQAGIDMARHELLTGVGFGNYEQAYAEFGLLNWPIPLGHAHNYYINVLAETGIFGAIFYIIFLGFVFFQLIELLRRTEWPNRGISLGLLAAWTALSVHQLVDNLYVNNVYFSIGVMLGLQQILAQRHD